MGEVKGAGSSTCREDVFEGAGPEQHGPLALAVEEDGPTTTGCTRSPDGYGDPDVPRAHC